MPAIQPDYAADEKRILTIVDSMYRAISWNDGVQPDFDRFRAPVRNDAVLIPASRPARPTDIKSFVNRMRRLHTEGVMKTFEEVGIKNTVSIFGNIAVAMGSFKALVDGSAKRG
jgi:hypothetical protein